MRGITVAEKARRIDGVRFLEQWGETNELDPASTRYYAKDKQWWRCADCGKDYKMTLVKRVNTLRGCYHCRSKKATITRKANTVARLGTLVDVHPEVVARWHPEKNLPLTPESFPANDKGKHWWLCSCGAAWEGPISNRVRRDASESFTCPPCSYRRGGDRNAANALERNGSLAETHGELFSELDRERNLSELNIPGERLHHQSQVKVFWRCQECGGSYRESPARRVNIDAGCSDRACLDSRIGRAARLRSVAKYGSLLEEQPILCEEWDGELNTISPEDVSMNSQVRAWWRCRECSYSWGTAVRNRAVHGHECPRCAGKVVMPGVDDFATKHPELVHRFLSFVDGEAIPLGEVKFRSHRLARWECAEGHVSTKIFQ